MDEYDSEKERARHRIHLLLRAVRFHADMIESYMQVSEYEFVDNAIYQLGQAVEEMKAVRHPG